MSDPYAKQLWDSNSVQEQQSFSDTDILKQTILESIIFDMKQNDTYAAQTRSVYEFYHYMAIALIRCSQAEDSTIADVRNELKNLSQDIEQMIQELKIHRSRHYLKLFGIYLTPQNGTKMAALSVPLMADLIRRTLLQHIVKN